MSRECISLNFWMHFDEEDTPDKIIWMIFIMRRTILQYGNTLFLDAQKRQYNKICWPYIGLVVKTSKHRIRCIGEFNVITEDNDMYKPFAEYIVDMEPKWSTSQLRSFLQTV